MNPFNLPGPQFLALDAGLLVLTVIAGLLIPRWLRPAGRERPVRDPAWLAVLAGGHTRFTDMLIARLLAARTLIVGADGLLVAAREGARTAAERALVALPQPLKLPRADRALKPHAREVEDELIAAELMMAPGTVTQLRLWQTAPYALLLLFGAFKWDVGVARDKPVGFLTILLALTAVLAVVRLAAVDRRTRAGQDAVIAARLNADRLRRAPTGPETGLAVALFGTTVLVGSGFALLHQLRAPSSDSGSGGGDSGGDGGGGGGGGCGGCGG